MICNICGENNKIYGKSRKYKFCICKQCTDSIQQLLLPIPTGNSRTFADAVGGDGRNGFSSKDLRKYIKGMSDWRKKHGQKLSDIFQRTYGLGKIHLDEIHGLVAFNIESYGFSGNGKLKEYHPDIYFGYNISNPDMEIYDEYEYTDKNIIRYSVRIKGLSIGADKSKSINNIYSVKNITYPFLLYKEKTLSSIPSFYDYRTGKNTLLPYMELDLFRVRLEELIQKSRHGGGNWLEAEAGVYEDNPTLFRSGYKDEKYGTRPIEKYRRYLEDDYNEKQYALPYVLNFLPEDYFDLSIDEENSKRALMHAITMNYKGNAYLHDEKDRSYKNSIMNAFLGNISYYQEDSKLRSCIEKAGICSMLHWDGVS